MSLFESDLCGGRRWNRGGDFYAVTKKPRGLDRSKCSAIPFAAMEAIPQGGAYMPAFTLRQPKEISSGTYFERGDILVAKITPCFENGKQALIRDLSGPFGYATTEVIPLHPIGNQQDPRLLFFYLLHPDVRHYVAERMEGSTGRKRVPENVLLDLPIPSIEPDEQIAIANALESIQQALAVEVQCEQAAQKLKRTTMQVLFTRGMRGETHKETEIGPVPKSWELIPIYGLGQIVTGNTPPTNDPTNYIDGDIQFIAPGDIEHGCAITRTEKLISRKGLKASRPLKPGSTCFVCIGSTIGKVGYTMMPICATNQQINSIIPSERFDPLFVFHLMAYWSDFVRKQASPSPVPILSKGAFEQIEVFSSVDKGEQKQIASILDAIDRKIDLHRRKRAVLEELFKALLHKLMTGEIRVADLDLTALTPRPAAEAAA